MRDWIFKYWVEWLLGCAVGVLSGLYARLRKKACHREDEYKAIKDGQLALQAALVHLLFNLFATLLIYGLPFLRNIPVLGATTLARLGADNKLYIVGWVLGVFLALPALLIFLTVVL